MTARDTKNKYGSHEFCVLNHSHYLPNVLTRRCQTFDSFHPCHLHESCTHMGFKLSGVELTVFIIMVLYAFSGIGFPRSVHARSCSTFLSNRRMVDKCIKFSLQYKQCNKSLNLLNVHQTKEKA